MGKVAKSIVEYRVYDLPLGFPALLLHGEQWRISDALSNRLHFHNCLEIGFCHTDAGTLAFEGETLPFRAGDITIIPRHIPHTTCSQKGTKSLWSYLFLDLSDLLRTLKPMDKPSAPAAEDILPETFIFNRSQHPRIHFIANCMLEEFKNQKEDWESSFKALSLVLYQELLRLRASQHKMDPNIKSFVLKPVLEHIRHHYMEQTTVKQLADICHLSEPHFRRIFLSIMGSSPLSFVNATRINQACILLDTTDLSILAVAEAVGISSISSFNRIFHSSMGVSPREYRSAPSKVNPTPTHKYILTYKGWMSAEDRPEHVTPTS